MSNPANTVSIGGGTIAAGFARALFELAVARGADRTALAAGAGFAPGDLQDADTRLPLDDYIRLMRAAKDLTRDPALALRFGEAGGAEDLSIVASLGQNGDTAAAALAELNRFSPLGVDVDTGGRPRMEPVRRGGRLWFVDRRTDPNSFPELTESTFARIVCGARRSGFAAVKQVHFTHSAPGYRSEYDRIFGIPLEFGCAWNAIELDPAVMARRFAPPSRPSKYVHAILVERAEQLLADLEASKSLAGRVERLLLPRLASGGAGAASVAAAIGISRQTLHRRLRQEGMSFARLRDGLRRRLAERHLASGASVTETAERLGFSDRAAFSRAFERWTGRRPRRRTG